MTPGDIQELEAAITDGSTSEMASIMWSVRAATGTDSNFLTVTGNGRMVSIIANSAGQGTVFAVFGAQIAQCDVIVQSNKKMAFQTGIVSGSPGDNFVVAYDYSPASLSISWTISDASVATYTDDTGRQEANHYSEQGRNSDLAGHTLRWGDVGLAEHNLQVGQDPHASRRAA